MKFISVLIAVIFSATCIASAAPSSQDTAFVKKAQADLLGQYAIASLGARKAHDPALKALAAHIATETSKGTRYLKHYAAVHHLDLAVKPAFREDAQYAQLSGLSGKTFDVHLARALNIDAQFQGDDFTSEVSDGSDAALKAFARHQAALLDHVSTVAQHYDGVAD
ncbi:MAG: DUF4142 domain-containing protein [bacterium]|nr:DUF4142 domain-containing protein [bacterium]